MQIKTGSEINVVKDNKMSRGTVTSVRDGAVDVKLADGTVVSGVKHVSQGDKTNGWYHKSPGEALGGPGDDPNVIELG